MNELTSPSSVRPQRFHFDWTILLLLHPRQAFAKIADQEQGTWQTPILLRTLIALAATLIAGWLKQKIALAGGLPLPPDFQYYTPEQQAQFMQAAQTTQGPVFMYVLPAIGTVLGVWLGWLLTGGLLHLISTLLGGRGETSASMNMTAWASLPLALRDVARSVAMLISQRLISNPGLSGFAPTFEGNLAIFLAKLLALLDLYLIWHSILLILGLRATASLPTGKAVSAALLTVLIILSLQALLGLAGASIGNLTIVRPFFF